MKKFIKKIIKVGNSLAVTFPQDIVKLSNLKEGQIIEVSYKTNLKG